jgi:heavy metal sensor kinase
MTVPIRLRLTLIYIGLSAVGFLLFASLLFFRLRASLLTQVDTDVISNAQGAAQLLRQEIAEKVMEMSNTFDPDDFEEINVMQGTFIQLLMPDGRTLRTSLNMDEERLWGDGARLPNKPSLDTFNHPRFGRLRRYTLPVTTAWGRYAVSTAESLASVERVTNALRRLIFSTLPLTLLLIALMGYTLTRQTLRPVAAITDTALAISTGDLNRRIALSGPRDEITQLADTFDYMIDSLERQFTRERQFIADASHELRTPLTVILSALEVTLGAPSRDGHGAVKPALDDALETMHVVQDEAQRMKRLVDDLLTSARLSAGQQPLHWETVSLDELVVEVCESALYLMGDRQFTVELDENIAVKADADRLKQLLLNLLDNAVKHTPPDGKVEITLRTRNGQALLTVRDDGEGIPPEHLPYIFDRFYRVDKMRSRQTGGTGLGLSICRWIAEAHGGALTVQSELGRGTTFTLTLPQISLGAV